jgi:alginate O-acetyltransferase complex protein AlgI
MVFSSVHFLFLFLPGFLGLYYATPPRFRNLSALAASLLFCAWGAPQLVFYLAASCAVDYGASRLLVRFGDRPGWPKRIAGAAIALNLGLLVYFKYANFLVREVNGFLSHFAISPVAWSDVALPIGISFFTFHRVSYLVDVYRKVTPPARSFADYLLYILLFPQLIAGPIVRYHEVAGEIAHREHRLELFFEGVTRFVLGLGKKVLLANVLGEVADRVFAIAPGSVPTSYAWLGIFCYTFQIYFDFAGYSDMAVGMARMMGIHFPENFNHPYISRSLTEFWRRWHISLSSFMREYLYIPLGGSRAGPVRTYVNLWVVFLVSGFWHGASWNFIVWGAFHGFFLVLDKLYWLKKVERLPRAVGMALTFGTVLVGWVLFRSADLPGAVRFLSSMLGWSSAAAGDPSVPPWPRVVGGRALLTLGVAVILSFLPAWEGLGRGWKRREEPSAAVPGSALRFAGLMLVLVLSLSYLSSSLFNPFLYFRF